jgi:putative membrane protein
MLRSRMASPMNDRLLGAGVAAVSFSVFGFLVWLVYLHPPASSGSGASSVLPFANAVFNLLCTVCLIGGYRAIRTGRRQLHIALMLSAVVCSALFLAGYVAHHFASGDTPFRGQGFVRPVYFAILISHVLVTAVALPMILFTLAHAAAGRFADHRRIARRTLPLWLYVSATGVLVFVFLRWWA